jgi:hypothetical protein
VICGAPVELVNQSRIVEFLACDISQKRIQPFDSIQKELEHRLQVSVRKLIKYFPGAQKYFLSTPIPDYILGV